MRHAITSAAAAALILLAAGGAEAQPREHGWIDVDVARVQSGQDAQVSTFTSPLFLETAAAAAAYPALPAATGLELAGGVGIWRGLGVGVHVNAIDYTSVVGLAVTIPSPYFFSNAATDATVTDSAFDRKERSVDVNISYAVPLSNRVTLRVYGGPTYFSVENEMVEVIHYNQLASRLVRLNVVDITSFSTERRNASAWGVNGGIDAAVFFTSHIGAGGGVRVNHGMVTVADPLNGDQTDLTVGHVVLHGGLRLRF